MLGLTAAHRTLPFNTLLRVTKPGQRALDRGTRQRSRSVSQRPNPGSVLCCGEGPGKPIGAGDRVKIRIVGTLAPRPPSPVARKN